MTETFSALEIFTEAELTKAAARLKARREFHAWAIESIIEPALPRINRATGQENDAGYLAYALEFAAGQGSRDA